MGKTGVEETVLGGDLNDWLKVIREINSGGGSAIFAGESRSEVELAMSDYSGKHGRFDIDKYRQNSYGVWIQNFS